MDDFTRAYIEAALWSSFDDAGEPLLENYDTSDIDPETIAQMTEDCRLFQEQNADDLSACENEFSADVRYNPSEGTILEYAGHDFWLTRNRHGAGFWDGDWPEEIDERLSKSAKEFGTYDLSTIHDGIIYGT